MNDYEETVLSLFDNCPTRLQITKIAKTFMVTDDEIKNILQKNGRENPTSKRGPKPKSKGFEAQTVILDEAAVPSSKDVEVAKTEDGKLPMPEYVKEILMNQLDSLDDQIKQMEAMLVDIKSKYKVIADYIKN